MAEAATEVPEFDRDIAVVSVGETAYAADLAAGWVVGGGINGGYLLAVVGSALRQHFAAKPDPIVVSAYYCSASVPGPAEVRVDVRRDGGSLATAAAELWQGDELRLTTLATYGDLAALHQKSNPVERVTAVEPDLPPRDRCVPTSLAPDAFRKVSPMLERFEMLFAPDQVTWAVGEPSGDGTISAWYRLHDHREPDPLSLLQVVDALPPVTFDLGMPGWAPTLELTAHIRHLPEPGWLKVHHTTRNLAGGMFEEDCEVWDSAGRLVAQSRQLARVPRPR
ncbi:thioesterase family protein [Nocardioides sp. KR10-350]|uniref:thioesterase family protein n=1 Tax=Nocardioides cheoyonin TaxID=3156615 RepID=UPI0032B382AD